MNEAITNAQAPDTFDILSFVEGSAYPTLDVTVHTDAQAGAELVRLNKERIDQADPTPELDERVTALIERIKASALTFTLQGMAPGTVRELYSVEDDATDEEALKAENGLIASTIKYVTRADGARDNRVWDADAVAKLRIFLKEAEVGKLVKGMIDVNFNAAVFDDATDAGFLGGSADVE